MELDINADLISYLHASTVEEVEHVLASALVKRGDAKPSFISAILEREAEFPTALDLGNHCVAIPHADSRHTIHGGISIGILRNPVMWHRMDDPDRFCPVSLVLMLAVENPHDHLDLLQRIIALVQNCALVDKIMSSEKPEEVTNLITPELLG